MTRSDKFEMIFSSRRFFQKTNEPFQLYYYGTSGRRVFVHFLEEIEESKKEFQNYLTFNWNLFIKLNHKIVDHIEFEVILLTFFLGGTRD